MILHRYCCDSLPTPRHCFFGIDLMNTTAYQLASLRILSSTTLLGNAEGRSRLWYSRCRKNRPLLIESSPHNICIGACPESVETITIQVAASKNAAA